MEKRGHAGAGSSLTKVADVGGRKESWDSFGPIRLEDTPTSKLPLLSSRERMLQFLALSDSWQALSVHSGPASPAEESVCLLLARTVV